MANEPTDGTAASSGPAGRRVADAAAAAGVIAALLFAIASFWGDLRIQLPRGGAVAVDPAWFFWPAAVLAGLTCLAMRRRRPPDAPSGAEESAVAGRGEDRAMAGWILFAAVAVAVRLAYKVYYPVFLNRPWTPALLVLVPVTAAAAGWGAWRAYRVFRAAAGAQWAWFGAILWTVSPMAFPLIPHTAAAYVVAGAILPGLEADADRAGPAGWKPWLAALLAGAGLVAVLGAVGAGWAFGRLRDEMADRLLPGAVVWLAGAGCVSLFVRGAGLRSAARRAGLAALPGCALGGARGGWGMAGLVLCVPFVMVCATEALRRMESRLPAGGRMAVVNIARLCLAGMLTGFLGGNVDRNIHVRRPETRAAPPPAEEIEERNDI